MRKLELASLGMRVQDHGQDLVKRVDGFTAGRVGTGCGKTFPATLYLENSSSVKRSHAKSAELGSAWYLP